MTAPTFEDGAWYWVEKEGWIGDPPTIAPALYKAQSDAWYSFAFSGIPTREVKVLEPCRRAPAVPTRKQIEQYLYEQGAVTVSRDVAEAAGLARLAGKMQSAPVAPVPQGLREAAQAVVERWDTPLWKDVPATAVYIADLRAALSAAPQPPEADHIPGAGKMDANVHNRMKAALSKDVACPACGLSGLHACPSASTTAPHCPDAATALEKVLRAVQRHLPPERIGERETIAEIISIVDPWPLGKPPEPWKDHMTAELVGKLTDVARQFHGTQQLRERIAGLVRPVCERIKQFDGDRMPEGDMGNHISAAAPVQLPEIDAGWFKYDKVSRCWHPQYSEYAETHAKPQGWQKLYTEQQVRALLEAKASVSNGTLSDVCQRENLREGEPYDNPAFEALARALGVWGTAQSAVCAQFWIAAKEQST